MDENQMDQNETRENGKNWVWMAVLLVVGIFLAISLMQEQPGGDYGDFLDALAMRESSNNYAAVNQFNYLGRYQLGSMALKDAGFQDENGLWTERANSYGIFSQQDFLQSPEGQDAAVAAYHGKLCRYISVYDLDEYLGDVYCDVEVTASGLLAACHLVGVGSMKEALATGQKVYDGNRVPASEYLELFAGYDISEIWVD